MSGMDKTGLPVIYLDTRGTPRHAILTADWNKGGLGPVNLVFVSPDESRQDSYGRQVERATSVAHISNGNYAELKANCWYFEEEASKYGVPPTGART